MQLVKRDLTAADLSKNQSKTTTKSIFLNVKHSPLKSESFDLVCNNHEGAEMSKTGCGSPAGPALAQRKRRQNLYNLIILLYFCF